MTKPLLSIVAATMLTVTVASTLRSQSAQDRIAYDAIMRTPVGALSPVMTNGMIDRLQNGASLAFRFGHVSSASSSLGFATNAVGVTGVIPVGLGSSFSVTGGLITTDCSGCNAELMLSAGGDMRLFSSAFGTTQNASLVTVSVDGEVGYGNRDPGSLVSLFVGAPIALVARGTGMQFVPFLTPGFGIGQASVNGASDNGSLMTLGGGLGIYNMLSNVSVNVGFQHPFMTNGQTSIGLTVTIGGK